MKFKSLFGYLFVALISMAVLTGCGDGGGSETNDTVEGIAQLGYIQSGTVSLYNIKNLNTPIATTKTSSSTDISKAGSFSFKDVKIDNNQYYLITVTKGKDIDADDNGQIDNSFTDVNGTVHAIVSGSDLKSNIRVNALTDMAYMKIKDTLSTLNTNSLKKSLDEISKGYVGDINKDGEIIYSDILSFNPIKDRDKIKINYNDILSSYIPSIYDNSSNEKRMYKLLINDKPKLIIENGTLQKVPFKLNMKIENLPKGLSVEWYLDGQKISLREYTFSEEGTYYLIGKLLNGNHKEVGIVSSTISAINPKLVSSFKAKANEETVKYIYSDSNSSLSGVSILIPKGAIKKDTNIQIKESTIVKIPSTKGLPISKLLTLEPTGLKFDKSIIIKLPYEGDISNDNIRVVRNSNGVIDFIEPLYIDKNKKVVVFETEHFSNYSLEKGYNFIDDPKREQKELLEFDKLFGVEYSNDEWVFILNKKIDKKGKITIYDLASKYAKLNTMSSFIEQEKYANAIKIVYPNSSSTLQKTVDAVKSLEDLDNYASRVMNFKPDKIVGTTLLGVAEGLIKTYASLIGVPSSVTDVAKLGTYTPKPHEILAEQISKIEDTFYSTLWSEFISQKKLDENYEDAFMKYEIQSDLIKIMMSSGDDNLKPLVTADMVHNLKLIFLQYQNFQKDKEILLSNIKLAIKLAHEDDKNEPNVNVIFRNYDEYIKGKGFKIPITIFPTGYGTDTWKKSEAKITLYLNDKKYVTLYSSSFAEENINGTIGFKYDSFISAPNIEGKTTMTWKYSDERNVEKTGTWTATFIEPEPPKEVQIKNYKISLDNISEGKISIEPEFNEYVSSTYYNCKIIFDNREIKGCVYKSLFQIYDLKTVLEGEDSDKKRALKEIKVEFSPDELYDKYIFEKKEYSIDLVDIYNKLQSDEIKKDWEHTSVFYYTKTPDTDRKVQLKLTVSKNIKALKLDVNNDNIYDKKLNLTRYYITVSVDKIGHNKTCVLFQHQKTQEKRRICTNSPLLSSNLVADNINKEYILGTWSQDTIFINLTNNQDNTYIKSIGKSKLGNIVKIAYFDNKQIEYQAKNTGLDTFSYTLTDTNGIEEKTGYITINIKAKNTNPTVTLSLGNDFLIEEGKSKVIPFTITDTAKQIKSVTCFTTPSISVFSNTNKKVSFTAPSWASVKAFTIRCQAKDATKVLASSSVKVTVTKKSEPQPTPIPTPQPEPQNEAPTVTLPSQTLLMNQENTVTPTTTDDKGITSYVWNVSWSGKQGTVVSALNASSLKLNIPNLEPGESGSATVSITVKDEEGLSDTATKTYSYSVEKEEALQFVSDNFTDGETLAPSSSKPLEWKIKNVSNVDLKNVVVNLTQEATALNVEEITPKTIALWEKGETKTFTTTLSVPYNVTAGTHKQVWNFSYDGGKALPYEGQTSSASIFFEFKTTDPQELVGRLITDKKLIKPNETITSLLEITSGNEPYSIEVNWGDGNNESFSDVSKNNTNSMTKSLTHTYANEGSYNIEVKVTDSANKQATFTDTIKVETNTITTSWTADAHDIVTDAKESNINIAVNNTEYRTSWSEPSGSTEYFVKYRLPVPSNLLKLDRKVRVTVRGIASNIVGYDREINFRTSSALEYTASIRDANFEETLDDGAKIKGGYFTIKNLSTGAITKEEASTLNTNSVEDGGLYSMEINPEFEVISVAKDATHYELLSKDINLNQQSWLSELDITFKGNGIIQSILLEYDKDGNGEFSADEKLVLNTVDKVVDWGKFGEEEEIPSESNMTFLDDGITAYKMTQIEGNATLYYDNNNLVVIEGSFKGRNNTDGTKSEVVFCKVLFTPKNKYIGICPNEEEIGYITYGSDNGEFPNGGGGASGNVSYSKNSDILRGRYTGGFGNIIEFSIKNEIQTNLKKIVLDNHEEEELSDLNFNNMGSSTNALIYPNGGENWEYDTNETVQWNTSEIVGESVDIYVLHDDPSDLNNYSLSLTTLLNNKNWYKFASTTPNNGTYVINPRALNGQGNAYVVLIVGSESGWDVSNGLITLGAMFNETAVNGLTIKYNGEILHTTSMTIKSIEIREDTNGGYAHIPNVRATLENGYEIGFKYCALNNTSDQSLCQNDDWGIVLIDETNTTLYSSGGGFGTSDDPYNGKIKGTFSSSNGDNSIDGIFDIEDMTVSLN